LPIITVSIRIELNCVFSIVIVSRREEWQIFYL